MAIQTVTGPIDPETLGVTLMHEHTLCDLWAAGGQTTYTGILDDEELQAEELARYREAGGNAVVDVTTGGAGRNPAGMRRLAEATGLSGSIVVGLALVDGKITADAAFDAAQLEETHQMERWGEDAEAAARRASLRIELRAVSHFARLLAG